jgi:hypothetical protein
VILDCGHDVPEGDTAFAQDWYQIKVSGTKVVRENIVRVVCEPCASTTQDVR